MQYISQNHITYSHHMIHNIHVTRHNHNSEYLTE